MENNSISKRKTDHIRINLEQDVQSEMYTKFDALHFEHQALPDFDLEDVDDSQAIFSKELWHPFLISSMTGGTEEAWRINQKLAQAAQQYHFAMGVGSQRAAIENPTQQYSFKIRSIAPDILLFANLGAIQLNYGYGIDQCKIAVDMIEADALILHLNPLQEALQPEGETRYGGLLRKIENICKKMTVPVIVREVGWGISKNVAERLISAGISAIDVSGAGGTSWSKVEGHRATDQLHSDIATSFSAWGIPTAESIRQVRDISDDILIFASGGIRNGVDAAKAIALGARLAGMAGQFLRSANSGDKTLDLFCQRVIKELQIAMFVSGAKNINQLLQTPLYHW